jgi:hypothetical protein
MRIDVSPLGKRSMVAMGREYWRSCLPTRYQALLEAGKLEQALTTAAEMTLEAMQSLRKAGFSEWEAWEVTREQYLLLEKEIGSGAGCGGACPKGNSLRPQGPFRPHHNSRARWTILEPRQTQPA